ncbi:uncharacterized protein FIBRA_06812 [Fibroporia radiculosa]|uniref:Uncharacterized protein n=1 Tax=Fibroporia radiculosa TaxID=599839 RepID=J4GCK3_9APHY|nr:uncharacterized protein FIBRA_06812 [Fibroporia radiculosa]CCM04628.1 predicted protein [Fibroporia radiculosa]
MAVRRFPGQEATAGDSKIPSIIYYDKKGMVRAVGSQALLPQVLAQAEDQCWKKVEWFKLHLRPLAEVNAPKSPNESYSRMAPLPLRKTIVDVLADFMKYLFDCTRSYVTETHANDELLWASVKEHIDFVFSHPNGWGGTQQEKMRRAAIKAGLIPDTPAGRVRIQFVTEGEASVHYCITSGLARDIMKNGPVEKTVMIVDAGGGTVDISTYVVRCGNTLTVEEIAPPECIYQGSAIVSFRAKDFLKGKIRFIHFDLTLKSLRVRKVDRFKILY